jgi:hypothetical protein
MLDGTTRSVDPDPALNSFFVGLLVAMTYIISQRKIVGLGFIPREFVQSFPVP